MDERFHISESWNRRPGITRLMSVPDWLGGHRVASYIVRHAWTRWLILWPLIKLKRADSANPQQSENT